MGHSLIFVQPPLPANERHKRVLPLGLAYMAAYIRQRMAGLPIQIVDGQAHNLSPDEVIEKVMSASGGRKIVGITHWTCQAPAAFYISREIKLRDPRATVIHGGIHATIFPAKALEVADYAVLHEGEETIRELLQFLSTGSPPPENIRGIAYRAGAGKKINPPRPLMDDLDAIPFPAWDLLDIKAYDSPLHVVGGRRLPVIGSRGCPYGCTYCGSPLMWRRRVRWRSPENVLAELKASIEKLGLSQFHFWDDNLMLERSYIEGLCRLIIAEGLSIKWTGLTRASHIARNADLMGLLKEAGCIGLEVGIESANPKTFYTIQKEENLQVIQEVARVHKEHGMTPLFTYMAFNPGETISGYYEQARFIDRLISDLPWLEHFHPMPFPLYTGQFCTPHVGTRLHDEAPELGEVLVEGFEDYYHHKVNFVPNSLLDDIPMRNVPRLDLYHYRLCGLALWYSFWSDFNARVPVEEQRRVLSHYRDSLGLFWALSNGRRRVGEIAASVSEKLNISRPQAIRFCAFTSLILGQMGVIKSGLDDADRERREIRVAGMEQVSGALKPLGGEMPRSGMGRNLRRYERALRDAVRKWI